MSKDKSLLLELAEEWNEKLVPLDHEELSLLSLNAITQKVPKGMYYTEKGILSSVYEEPLISYGYRKYFGRKAILVARTVDSIFEFIQRGANFELRINNHQKGFISEGGKLMNGQGKEVATLQLEKLPGHHDVLIEGQKLATIVDPEYDTITQNSRAFSQIKSCDEEQKNLLTALTLYNNLLRE